MVVYYKVDLIIISLKINLSSSWYSRKIAELVLNNNYMYSLTRGGTIWHPIFVSSPISQMAYINPTEDFRDDRYRSVIECIGEYNPNYITIGAFVAVIVW